MKYIIHVDGWSSGYGKSDWIYQIEGDSSQLSRNGTSTGKVSCTVNRAILVATIAALNELPSDCEVMIKSRHAYLTQNINYIEGWKSRGWKTKKHKGIPSHEIMHIDLWKEIDGLLGNLAGLQTAASEMRFDVTSVSVQSKPVEPKEIPKLSKSPRATPIKAKQLINESRQVGRCKVDIAIPTDITDGEIDSLKRTLLNFSNRKKWTYADGPLVGVSDD